MRKYLTADIALTAYKQTILPLYDNADFLIESGPIYRVNRLDNLHEKVVNIKDNSRTKHATFVVLSSMYHLNELIERRRHHHAALMYGKSKLVRELDLRRPCIFLHSHDKIKFKKKRRNYATILKCSMYRGVKLWNHIPVEIQRSTTKSKFKQLSKTIWL